MAIHRSQAQFLVEIVGQTYGAIAVGVREEGRMQWERVSLRTDTSENKVTICVGHWGSTFCCQKYNWFPLSDLTGLVSVEMWPSEGEFHQVYGARASWGGGDIGEIEKDYGQCSERCEEGCFGPTDLDCGTLSDLFNKEIEGRWKFVAAKTSLPLNFRLRFWAQASNHPIPISFISLTSFESNPQAVSYSRFDLRSSHHRDLELCVSFQGRTSCSATLEMDSDTKSYMQLSVCGLKADLCVLQKEGKKCVDVEVEMERYAVAEVYEEYMIWAADVRYDAFCDSDRSERDGLHLSEELQSPQVPSSHVSRRLTVNHYARYTVSNSFKWKNFSDLYTFVNTHTQTISIVVSVRRISWIYGTPHLTITKKNSQNNVTWLDSITDSYIKITPTDPQLSSLGENIMGTYQIKVYSYEFWFEYELVVLIACASTDFSCFCASGKYPKPDTSSCSPCASGNAWCPIAASLGCLPANAGTELTSGFLCNVCPSTSEFLDQSKGVCAPCNASCKVCAGGGANMCIKCASTYTHLASNPPAECVCNDGLYFDTTKNRCAWCSSMCKTCSGGAVTKCKTCEANATLISSSPSECKCNPGYTGTPDSCNACTAPCSTCTGTSTYKCMTCLGNMVLKGTAPSGCECANGYYNSSGSCLPCDLSCNTCKSSQYNSCTSCKINSKLSGNSPCLCLCVDGYYGTPPNCIKCPPCCSKCTSLTSCSKCCTNATLTSSSCSCNSGFFLVSPTGICSPCDSTCSTCEDGTPEKCKSCKLFAAVLNGGSVGNCVCTAGYFPNSTSALCTICDSTCQECVGAKAADCTKCNSAFVLQSGTCVCPADKYLSSSSCQACDLSCLTCNGAGSSMCTSCNPTATLSSGKCACGEGYQLSGNACEPCPVNCKVCSGTSCDVCFGNATSAAGGAETTGVNIVGTATTQTTGTTRSLSSVDCPSLDSGVCYDTCSTCTGYGPAYCKSCKSSAILIPQSSSLDYGYCKCSPNHFPSLTASNCASCHASCEECIAGDAAKCTKCPTNSMFANGTSPGECKCIPGFFSKKNICTECDKSCKACDTLSTTCTDCFPNAVLTSTTCTCLIHFTLDQAQCQPCHPTCSSCTEIAANKCSTCYDGAKYQFGSCVCEDNRFPDPDSANCNICDTSCKKCVAFGTDKCTECNINFELQGGVLPGTCVCSSHYFSDSGGCSPCDESCFQCFAAAASCTDCYPNATLDNNSQCKCDPSFFASPKENNCVQCHPTCNSCTSPDDHKCTSCVNPMVLENNENPGKCVCITKTFLSPNTTSCSACFFLCNTCKGDGEFDCDSCVSEAKLTENGNCLCNEGHFPDSTSQSCIKCDATCKSCDAAGADKCTGCFANAILENDPSPSACVCSPQFFQSTDVAHCKECHVTCNGCSSSDESSCLDCYLPARKKDNLAKDMCVCDSNSFPDPDSSRCSQCEETCLSCVGGSSSQCTACHSHASIESGFLQGQCVCDSHYYPAATSLFCSPCDPLCKECNGPSSSDCLQCFDFAKPSENPSGLCVCDFGFFAAPDATSCKACDATCKSCATDKPDGCVTCYDLASLQKSPPAVCICVPGTYADPDSSHCLPCPNTCQTCRGPSEYLTCKPYAVLLETTCECESGFYPNSDAGNCVKCADGCLRCDSAGCLKCKPDYWALDKECLQSCPHGYRGSSQSQCESIDMTAPVAFLAVSPNNTLSVDFDKPMNCSLDSSDIDIDASSPDGRELELSWGVPVVNGDRTFLIDLWFQEEYILAGSKVTLTFLFPDQVIAENEVPISITTLYATLQPFGNPPQNATKALLNTPVAQQAAAASKGGVSAGAMTSLVSGNPAGLITMVNQLQLISYISMTKLPIPTQFASTLAAMNVGQMLPNPFADYLSVSIDLPTQQPPKHVEKYGLDTMLFLVNGFSFLGMAIGVLLSFVPIYMLSKLKIRFVADYFGKMLPSLKWTVPLQLWVTSYLDLAVFSLLQLRIANESLSDAFSVISLILAGLVGIAIVVTPVFLLVFTVQNYSLISSRADNSFNKRWGFLYLPFKPSPHVSDSAYYLVFLLRRLTLAVTLTLFSDFTGIIAVLNTSLGFLVSVIQTFGYVLVSRPFVERLDRWEAIVLEGNVFGVYLIASLFLLDLDSVLKETMDIVGMWMARAAIGFNTVFSIVRIVFMVMGLMKAYKKGVKYLMKDGAQVARLKN